ncbi:D-glucuronyl C5-epimerase family protein [Streptomyces xiaopingdaonensis]|uniref:D-glucuronyl C5-epimerase family protein n=1 Tax=Streptomyces xiaopingdaonensis TaxID=1565415 RepID=UPI0002FAF45E|nr:D-glucuronyl C5-epimerase family protein [Streptomyces xiaopingdaonensis]
MTYARALAVTLAAALTLTACARQPDAHDESPGGDPPRSRERAAGMPAFSEKLAPMAKGFYDMAWTADGYPGRNNHDGTVYEHPIYPTYVLHDYLEQYGKHPSPKLKAAIRTVAHATVRRLKPFRGALVAWYAPKPGTRHTERRYSALTQAYYAHRLRSAAELLHDRSLRTAARRAFHALTVPADKGGVRYRDRHGTSIAELPQRPNGYVLNGWQSALVSAWKYGEASGDRRAKRLVRTSARTMARMLPLYDAPEVANSRYGLTGYTHVRTVGADLRDARVSVPGEGSQGLVRGKGTELWTNHRVGPRQVNLVLSRASLPEPNVLRLDVSGPARVQVQVGEYDPLVSQPPRARWVTVGKVDKGRPRVEVGRDVLDKLAYPTNFVKKIDGRQTNVYHAIHIRNLRELGRITGDERFAKWAERWSRATCRWKEMPVYEGMYVRSNEPGARSVAVSDLCTRTQGGTGWQNFVGE